MRVLMDTHTFLWFAADDPRLSATARALVEDNNTEPLVSMASAWEISIKVGLGKLSLDRTIEDLFSAATAGRISILPISLSHAIGVRDLADHHRDPFDRLLVSQALCDRLPIVGIDSVFEVYGIRRIW